MPDKNRPHARPQTTDTNVAKCQPTSSEKVTNMGSRPGNKTIPPSIRGSEPPLTKRQFGHKRNNIPIRDYSKPRRIRGQSGHKVPPTRRSRSVHPRARANSTTACEPDVGSKVFRGELTMCAVGDGGGRTLVVYGDLCCTGGLKPG